MSKTNPETGTPYTQEEIDAARAVVAAADQARNERATAEAERAAAARAERTAKVAAIARMPEMEAIRVAIVALPSEALTDHLELGTIASMVGRLQSSFPA